MKILISYLILFCSTIYCGSDQSTQTQPPKQAPTSHSTENDTKKTLALQTENDLPDCNAKNNLQLVYIISDDRWVACLDSVWKGFEIGYDKEFDDGIHVWRIAGRVKPVDVIKATAKNCRGDWRAPTLDDFAESIPNGLFDHYDKNPDQFGANDHIEPPNYATDIDKHNYYAVDGSTVVYANTDDTSFREPSIVADGDVKAYSGWRGYLLCIKK